MFSVCTYQNKIELNTRMVSSPNANASTSEMDISKNKRELNVSQTSKLK